MDQNFIWTSGHGAPARLFRSRGTLQSDLSEFTWVWLEGPTRPCGPRSSLCSDQFTPPASRAPLLSGPRDGLARFGTVPAGAPLSHVRRMRNPPLGVGQGGAPADPFPAGGLHGRLMQWPGRAPSARSADAPERREDRGVLGPVPPPEGPAWVPPACDRLGSFRVANFRRGLALSSWIVLKDPRGGGYGC